jgi:hypothetical protein
MANYRRRWAGRLYLPLAAAPPVFILHAKIKDKVLKDKHLYQRSRLSKTTFYSVSQHILKRLRQFGNNRTSLFLNRPFISSYDRIRVLLDFFSIYDLYFLLAIFAMCWLIIRRVDQKVQKKGQDPHLLIN